MQSTLFGSQDGPSSGAILSDCGLYRYLLIRRWGNGPTVNFIMLNPSTADATEDDPTIRRCVGFARTWGFDALSVTNLYAFRATDPADLWNAPNNVGPENDSHIAREACRASMVVCAWGNLRHRYRRSSSVRAMLRDLGIVPRVIRLTKEGCPSHPLYLPGWHKPEPWSGSQ